MYNVRLPNSEFQNTSELIAFNMAVFALRQLRIHDCTIMVTGDSAVVLSWIVKENYRSERAARASVMGTVIRIEVGLRIGNTNLVRSEDNPDCDALSRGAIPLFLQTAEMSALRCSFDDSSLGSELIQRMLPVAADSDQQLTDFHAATHLWLSVFP